MRSAVAQGASRVRRSGLTHLTVRHRLLENPTEFIPPFEEVINQEARNLRPKTAETEQPIHLGFTGSFGFHRVSPRELLSPLMSKLVCLEGIVTKCTSNGGCSAASPTAPSISPHPHTLPLHRTARRRSRHPSALHHRPPRDLTLLATNAVDKRSASSSH